MPTYNRAEYIGETLDSVLGQCTDEVEVVILDGGSSDNTAEIVRRYQQRFPNLHFHQREKNMGVDRDIDGSVDLASGKFCWLMPSDDLLCPGAVAAVLEALRDEPSFLIINAEVWNLDFSEKINPSLLPFKDDRVYQPHESEQLFINTASLLSYMGALVIRKDLWISRDRASYFDTDFIVAGVAFQKEPPRHVRVLGAPKVAIRYGNATWSPRGFEIWTFRWPKVIWSLPGYSDSAKRQICPRDTWCDWRRMLLQRATGVYTMREYSRWIERQDGPRAGKLLARIIAILPAHFLNLLAIGHSRLSSRRGTALFDLRQSPFYWAKIFRTTTTGPSSVP